MTADTIQAVLANIAVALPRCLDDFLPVSSLAIWDYDDSRNYAEGDTINIAPEILRANPGSYAETEPEPVQFRLKRAADQFYIPSALMALGKPDTIFGDIDRSVGCLTDPIERDMLALLSGFPARVNGTDAESMAAAISTADNTLFDGYAPQDGQLNLIVNDAQYGLLEAIWPDINRTRLAGPFTVQQPAPDHDTAMPCGAAFHRNALCLATRRPRGYTAPDTRIMLHDGLLVTLSGSPDKDGPGMTVDLSIIYRCGILDRGLGVAIELPAGGPFRTAAQTEPAGAAA